MRLRLIRTAGMRKARQMQRAKWIGKVDARRTSAGVRLKSMVLTAIINYTTIMPYVERLSSKD